MGTFVRGANRYRMTGISMESPLNKEFSGDSVKHGQRGASFLWRKARVRSDFGEKAAHVSQGNSTMMKIEPQALNKSSLNGTGPPDMWGGSSRFPGQEERSHKVIASVGRVLMVRGDDPLLVVLGDPPQVEESRGFRVLNKPLDIARWEK